MILLHGYGAGACVFYKILKDLSTHFHLFVVDLLGMGFSGRPEFTAFDSVDNAEKFFVDSLREWKNGVWRLKGWSNSMKYYLAGHSLGGYISSVYAM